MWLDRLSGHPAGSGASSPYNRPYSPAGRQPQRSGPNKQNRPTYSPRSSSLSFSPTPSVSTNSLPLRPNNDGSRPGDYSSRDQNIPDPLDVLNNILGIRRARDDSDTGPVGKLDVLAETIDFGELSLEEFAAQEDKLQQEGSDRTGIQMSIDQYEKERDKFQELHTSISGCDEVLKSVESYLKKFQNELGSVSAEIESLQSRSSRLSSQLENRKNVERLLGPAVEKISVSPQTVRLISDRPVSPEWIKALAELESRTTSVESSDTSSDEIKAVEDVKPLLENLKAKAIERIRDYLVAQIKSIRSPNVNAQIVQQQALLGYKELFNFLQTHHPTLSEQIVQAYMNTMRWYYLSNFTRYKQALERIKLHFVDRNDLLGGDSGSQRNAQGPQSGRTPSSAHDPFVLGRRIDILKTNSPAALTSYLAEESRLLQGVEAPFRNFNLALIDNVSAEYSFMAEMFCSRAIQQASKKVLEIFDPVFSQGQAFTKQLIDNTTDCIGILICIRLNRQFAFELQRRKVPVAEPYINGTNMQLWPRFQIVMDMHFESLKKISSSSSRNTLTTLSLTAGDVQSSAPHFLTQRFGQFLHSILALSSEAEDDEPLSNSLGRLVNEFDALLTKLSKTSGDAKRRERFLCNNYSLILTIISDTKGKLATEQQEHFMSCLKSAGKR
ncbi:hypothetical protein FQN57_007443 [Myotisia sp. PD_48]|nr:hypothetical protein FQN57_007443 [Myotisia sp. PD_48]